MKITFRGYRQQITGKAIEELERQLGCKLPNDYRQFLLKHNGGIPDANCFYVHPDDERTTWIDEFCFVDKNLAIPLESAEPYSIAFERFKWEDKIPSGFMVIGISARDNLVLLAITGKRKGEVWLKIVGDLPIEEDWTKLKTKHMKRVADSFSAFLDKLDMYRGV